MGLLRNVLFACSFVVLGYNHMIHPDLDALISSIDTKEAAPATAAPVTAEPVTTAPVTAAPEVSAVAAKSVSAIEQEPKGALEPKTEASEPKVGIPETKTEFPEPKTVMPIPS